MTRVNSVADVVRMRRHRRRSASGGWATTLGLVVGVAGVLMLGGGIVAGGRVVLAAAADLPPASSLESFFGQSGSERFRAPQLFDRSGEALLAEVLHPLARDRQWQPLDRLPAWLAAATVAALDPSFWTDAGQEPAAVTRLVMQSVLEGSAPGQPATITERLAQQTLLRGSDSRLAVMLMADEISSAYPKERVLEWFLNSANYGNLAFGIDAAARVYLGKPADRLTVGEAALLAALPAHPEVDPLADRAAAQALQREVLASMRGQGWITAEQERAGLAELLPLQDDEARQAMQGLGFVQVAWEELRARIGAGAAAQGGARVITTLDLDLQLQADCVARSYLARMDGGDPLSVLPAADGSPCAAASLLPPLRPGDSGVDHGIEAAATTLLDPASGEILALTGPAGESRPAGGVLAPLVYLSAFSRGYTPATMVIDTGEGGESSGPVRLRTALAEGDASVTDQLLALLGPAVVESTLDLMGLDPAAAADGAELALDKLTAAYGVLANRGIQAGAASGGGVSHASILQAVYSPEGEVLYQTRTERRSVISEGLAFLLNEILSDEAARERVYGQGSALQVGRPAAAVTGQTATDNTVLGYTPQLVGGVRVGAEPGETLNNVHALNGAAPIWHALMRYAARDLPPEAWPRPPDVTELEVCDPSGYLPTPYCPRVVREVFLAGTEPTYSDTLYRPFRINRETGRLATYFTPLDQVEEIVFFVPPPEAEAWARAAGLESPPSEYDRVSIQDPAAAEVRLSSPAFLSIVAGEVDVVGSATGEGFASYRLDAGEGLDPRAWLQIGQAQETPVRDGRLGRWDTSAWRGAGILRLTVVRQDGTVETAAVPVTVDNDPPTVEIILPLNGAEFTPPADKEAAIQVEASDETLLDRVVVFVDDRPALTREGPPWSVYWPLGTIGEHRIRARAYDAAGNWADSEEVNIRVVR
jgi:membrane peptidoglycan carboxypeptidase